MDISAIGCIGDEEDLTRRESIGDHVVDDATALIAEHRVLRLGIREGLEVVGQDRIQECDRAIAPHRDLPEVGDIEDSNMLPDCRMLSQDPSSERLAALRILDWHQPTTEVSHLCATRYMKIMKRRKLRSYRVPAIFDHLDNLAEGLATSLMELMVNA